MGKKVFLTMPLLLVSSAVLASNLLPDMSAATTLKQPQSYAHLNLTQAVQRAIEWHPMITSATERLNQQGEEISFAKSAYYPQIKTGVKSSYRDSEGRSEEALTVTGSQLLYDFGKVSSRVEAAEYGVEKYQADSLRIIDQLARETAFAVTEVQRYQELVKIAGEQVAGVSDLLELSKKETVIKSV